jgi:hypothetical protein
MRGHLVPLAVLLALPPALASAQRISPLNGNRLLTLCTSRDAAGCDAYLSGIADAITVQGRAAAAACIPGEVTGTQLREVAVKYIRAHPERLQEKAGHLAVEAFARAFPCKGR